MSHRFVRRSVLALVSLGTLTVVAVFVPNIRKGATAVSVGAPPSPSQSVGSPNTNNYEVFTQAMVAWMRFRGSAAPAGLNDLTVAPPSILSTLSSNPANFKDPILDTSATDMLAQLFSDSALSQVESDIKDAASPLGGATGGLTASPDPRGPTYPVILGPSGVSGVQIDSASQQAAGTEELIARVQTWAAFGQVQGPDRIAWAEPTNVLVVTATVTAPTFGSRISTFSWQFAPDAGP